MADYTTFARRAASIGAALARDYSIVPDDCVDLFTAEAVCLSG
jgi:long-chain acyl-CoA synthetase